MALGKKKTSQQYETLDRADVATGMQVRVHQKITETNDKGEEKERIQVFEGLVIAKKHGNEQGASVTVRKVSEGIGVEKMFPLHSPVVDKIELVDTKITNRSKLYYTRYYKKRLRSTREKKVTVAKKAKSA